VSNVSGDGGAEHAPGRSPLESSEPATFLVSREPFSFHSLSHILPIRACVCAQLTDNILKLCTPAQLGMLQSTCKYFHGSKLIDKIAKHKLRMVPRARGLKARKKENNETNLALLHFVNCQSAAAAQATAVACGGYHTSALLIKRDSPEVRHAMYTFGRNFHGQLGTPDFEDKKVPVPVSLGFRPVQVRSGVARRVLAPSHVF
jgi:hypothetical protein